MIEFWILSAVVFAPVFFGLLTLLLPRQVVNGRMFLSLLGPVTGIVGLVYLFSQVGLTNASQPMVSVNWIPTVELNFAYSLDGLNAFFAMLVAGIGIMIVLYARGYFGKDAPSLYRFYPTLGFFTTAMIGITLSDNMLLMLLFWEMTSISSFLLIGWDRYDKHAVRLAMQAFFTTGMGGMAMLGGLVLFGLTTDLWRWSDVLTQAETINLSDPWIIAAFCMIFAGAATKSAQWPFHYWLPGAMAAPTPVSAYLHSATMVKAGVFLTARMFPVFREMDLWTNLIVPLGAVTMLYGAITAINQHDLKRIFAYTTVSQLGLLMCMYGLGGYDYHGHANIDWGISQIANHAFYKAPLFIAAGAIGHVLSRDITQLNGAFKKHPAICITLLLAGYGLAAGPGTISFQAKELFLYAVYHSKEAIGSMWMVLMGMTIITAVINVAIFVRLVTTLLGLPGGMQPAADAHHHDHHHEHAHEHGLFAHLIWLPGLLIVSLQYIGGFMPSLWSNVFMPMEASMGMLNYEAFAHGLPNVFEIFAHPGLPLYMSLTAMAGGIVLGLLPVMRGTFIDVHDRIYPGLYWLSVVGGGKTFRLIQTGHLRQYIAFVLMALLIGIIGAAYHDWYFGKDNSMLFMPEIHLFEYWPGLLIGLITIATALMLPIVKERVVRVLILGTCGFSVVALYLVYQAPDLALTQVMFEIISVILFVLVLRLLPNPDRNPRPNRLVRAAVAGSAGLVIGWMTLIAAPAPERGESALDEYFTATTYHGEEIAGGEYARGGGGNNIVNVILVDFRGFDTLGEITVLGIAAIGVWALLPGRGFKRRYDEELNKEC